MKLPASAFESRTHWSAWGSRALTLRRAVGWIAVVALSTVLAWIGVDLWSLSTRHEHIVGQLNLLQERLVQIRISSGSPAKDEATEAPLDLPTRTGLNQVIRRLNTPWPDVFESLERLTPTDVALIRIEPSGDGRLSIEAESIALDKLMAYANQLEHQDVFGAVVLRRHTTNERDPNRPARLTFQLEMKERVP